ncbi:MAG: c-type cytochrome [Verrucomicrobia bacterium]|nr:c-type cytochrome [Verrucomicrobiota bacterium]
MHYWPLRAFRVSALALGLFVPGRSAEPALESLPSSPAVEPADAAATFRVKRGFTMDLLAAEPRVASPVAMTYDENGNAYVVEMRDYPYTDKNTHQPWKENTTDAYLGRVRMLIDRDGDGTFDESFLFADGLSWPTGICCWKGGVYVTATPDVWYLKDRDGDHRADIRTKVFTGFRKYNVQTAINNPLWGLDNRIAIVTSSNGGQITTVGHPEFEPLKITSRDLRFDPRTEKLETIAGGTGRYGHSFDDWGNRFICSANNPAFHIVFDGTQAGRNPFLPAPNPVFDARGSGGTLPVLRISPLEPWRVVQAGRWVAAKDVVPRKELTAGGEVTSASGITLYRGAAYPPEFRGQGFVGEVANNVVHRQMVAPDGVTFKFTAADPDAEFVASTDTWFRPVNFINAPDGTLHVIDMYRQTVEHPWSVPDDLHARLDLMSGRERGRIYRLAPPGFKAPAAPRLGAASTAALAATLENANSWWRETAQRLLFERQDPAAVAPLRALLEKSALEVARLHALWTLDGLGALRESDLRCALGDASAGVREHAVRLAARRFDASPGLQSRVFALARDRSIRVRYQVAFAAGGVADDAAVQVAVELLRQDGGDRWVRAAVLGTSPDQCARIAQRLLRDASRPSGQEGREILRSLLFVAGAQNHAGNLEAIFNAFAAAPAAAAIESAFWTGLGDGLGQAGRNLRTAFRTPQSPAAQRVATLLAGALQTARSPGADAKARVEATRLLAYDDFASAGPVLGALLAPGEPQPLQLAAVRTLASFAPPEVGKILLASWASHTPAVREEVLSALLARRERIGELLTALETKVVSAGQLSPARRTQILSNPDATIKQRAGLIFGQNSSGSRAAAVEKYRSASALTGDSGRGRKVYDNTCAACHRYAGRGVDLGPPLETIRGWDREKTMLHILDPNREVAANYIAYVIDLKDGSSVSGMITEETAGSIKLKRVGAPEESVLRQNIAKITSSAISLMPEGLESALSPQDMADLLAHLVVP